MRHSTIKQQQQQQRNILHDTNLQHNIIQHSNQISLPAECATIDRSRGAHERRGKKRLQKLSGLTPRVS